MLARGGGHHPDLVPSASGVYSALPLDRPPSAGAGTSDPNNGDASRSASRTLALPVAPLTKSERVRAAVVERVVRLKKSSFFTACSSALVLAVGLTLLRGGSLFGEDGLFSLSSSYSYGLRSAGGGNSTLLEGGGEDGEELSIPDFTNPNKRVRLSRSLANVAGVDEPMRDGDVPFFFHVPRSGGSTLKDIMGMCLGQVVGSDVGTRKGHKYDKELKILEEDGSKFVNVDTTTAEGIHRAKRLGLVESNMADFVATQLLHPAATMFNKDQRGRMFTMIRHPIERAVSLFHYLGVADWEPTYDPDLAYISIEMYARSKRVEFNWMVRFLSNELERDLTPKHLEVAKEVLRTKALIGLLTEKGESFARFERYFGWTYPERGAKECQDRLLHWGWSNKHAHPAVEEGSPAWKELWKKNALDMELYEFAKGLFDEQAKLFQEGGAFGPEKAVVVQPPTTEGQQDPGAAAVATAGGAPEGNPNAPLLRTGGQPQGQVPSSASRSLAFGGGAAAAGQPPPNSAYGAAAAVAQPPGNAYGAPAIPAQRQQPQQVNYVQQQPQQPVAAAAPPRQ